MRAVAVDAMGNEQDIDVFLDIEEQSSDKGRVHVYGHTDIWRASFVPRAPFDPYARTPVEVLGVKVTPSGGVAR